MCKIDCSTCCLLVFDDVVVMIMTITKLPVTITKNHYYYLAMFTCIGVIVLLE